MPDAPPFLLEPLPETRWPAELDELRGQFFGRANVYRLMAHHPALMRAWTALRQHIVVDSALDPEQSEVVILRAASRLGSDYEWAHHVLRARKIGMSDSRIASMGGPVDAMAAEDAPLAASVDALLDDARLPPELIGALSEAVGTQGMLDLMATVGFYSTLAFILKSFDPPLEDDLAAELARQPLGRPGPPTGAADE